MNTKLCKEFFYFIEFFKDGILGTERENGKEDNVHFLLFRAFSLTASILKYSSTSSNGVSSFFPVALGVLF